MRTSALFNGKNLGFFEIYGFADKGGGTIFRVFVGTSLTAGP